MAAISFKKHGSEHRLSHSRFEGALIPKEGGHWHWWVRFGSRRYAGDADTLDRAKASLATLVAKLETGCSP